MDEPSSVGTAGYEAPDTVDAVIRTLQDYGETAKLLAGGQSLMVFLRQGMLAPDMLISLKRVKELREMSFSSSDGMRIGAMVTQAELEGAEDIRRHYTALGEAASMVASVQVRNQGTLGGNLCHADPTADPPAALIALGGTLEITGPDGARKIAAEEFFRDYLEVDVREDEVLTRVLLPPPPPRSGSAYYKLRVRQVDTAIVGAAAWLHLSSDGERVEDVRIGLSGVGMTPIRAVDAEDVLRGQAPSEDLIKQAAEAAVGDTTPLDDTEASEWYRREMIPVMAHRALTRALGRAQGQEDR